MALLGLATFAIQVVPRANAEGESGYIGIMPFQSGSWLDNAAPSFAGGTGTALDPWLISTPAQFARMGERVNNGGIIYSGGHFRVTQNIDMGAHFWFIAGSTPASAFAGRLDSISGAVISNLTHFPNTNRGSLFLFAGGGAVIERLTFNNARMTTAFLIDTLGGSAFGSVSPSITIRDITINSQSTITSVATELNSHIGGLIANIPSMQISGNTSNITIENINMHGSINLLAVDTHSGAALPSVGGIIGHHGPNGVINIDNVTVTGNISYAVFFLKDK